MHMLLNAVDLMDISEADRRRLLSNLREAEAAASRTRAAEQRRKTTSNAEEPQEPTTAAPSTAAPSAEDLQPVAADIEKDPA